jgi:hypothetical protein
LKLFNCKILPESLEEFIFSNNNTIGIVGFKEGLKYINLSANDFKIIYSEFPQSLEKLDISKNTNLCQLPKIERCLNLKSIDFSYTQISNMDNLPDSVEELFANNTNMKTISKFPNELLIFNACHANISEIKTNFPNNLKEFDVYFNNIEVLPNFPDSIENIDLSNNNLKLLPFFPETTSLIDLTNNDFNTEKIKQLKEEYKSTSIIFSEKTKIAKIPDKIVEQKFIPKFCESNPHFIIHTADYDI